MVLFDFMTLSGVLIMLAGIGLFAFAVFLFAVVLSFLLD
jgi:hypothetical protein